MAHLRHAQLKRAREGLYTSLGGQVAHKLEHAKGFVVTGLVRVYKRS
jgi:hypothetical protein